MMKSASFLLLASATSAFAPPSPLKSPLRHKNIIALYAKKEATFGMGCFWEPSETLLSKDGILATTVGYTGGKPNAKAPTYDSVCYGRDWVEAVRVVYDDTIVSYGD
eukprot:3797928-Ditylum_brightwellii.AAC.1